MSICMSTSRPTACTLRRRCVPLNAHANFSTLEDLLCGHTHTTPPPPPPHTQGAPCICHGCSSRGTLSLLVNGLCRPLHTTAKVAARIPKHGGTKVCAKQMGFRGPSPSAPPRLRRHNLGAGSHALTCAVRMVEQEIPLNFEYADVKQVSEWFIFTARGCLFRHGSRL